MATYQESTSGTLPFYNTAIEDLLNQGKTQLDTSMGQTAPQMQVAGLDPLQLQAQQTAQSLAGAYQPQLGQAQQVVSGALGAYSGLTGGVDPSLQNALGGITGAGSSLYDQAAGLYTSGAQFDPSQLNQYLNPYLGGVVDEIGRLGQERLEQQMLPALTAQFSSLGQFGSARQAALMADAAKQSQREVLGIQSTALNTAYNQAMQDYLNWSQQQNAAAQGLAGLGGQQAQQQIAAGQLGQNAYQAAQNLALQQAQAQAGTALDVGSSIGNLAQAGQQMGLADIGMLTAAGQMGQQQQQAQLDAQYKNQLAQQQYPWQQLGNYAQLFGAGTPQSTTSWQTSFKKGGLARFADGGRFQEPDVIEDQLQQLLTPRPMGANPYADQAMGMRQQFIGQLPSSPAFAPVPEPSTGEALGEAMMRASAQGPANLGQLIGRSGSAFFDAERERREKNREAALNRLMLEQRSLPAVGAGLQRSLSGPSPEQVRTVYTSARNEAAQIAKDYQFDSAEDRSAWIEQQANAAVENYLSNFSTDGGIPRGRAAGISTASPTRPMPQSSHVPAAAPATEGEWPSAYNPVQSPLKRNRAEEEREKKFATGSEEAALKTYEEEIRPGSRVAEGLLSSVATLRQIPRTQDKFAPYREVVGSVMDALGLDGRMAREAESLQQVRPLLAKIANDRLLLAKGVQTEGDAQRAYNEFIKIEDTQAAADFMYEWTEELARRAKFKDEIYRTAAQQEGTWQRGQNWWERSDYAQAPPVALLNGRPWGFSKWREQFLQQNPDATIQDVIEVWNDLVKRGR